MRHRTRSLRAPAGSFFLLGPRGTGKTSWVRQHYPDALWVDLLDPETHRQLIARPERLREWCGAHPGRKQVVIDEVQKIPELLEVVHQLIESGAGLEFVLTGSSARKLRRAGVNLLGGRAVQSSMHPYLAGELGAGFSLESALEIGLVPLVVEALEPRETLRAYSGLYLRQEVQAEGLVRRVGDFARFLEAISFSHGAVLNLSNVARECAVTRKAAEGYLEILEDLLLAYRVPVFTRRAQRALAAHPKFYFFDAGVFRASRPLGPLDAPADIAGAALEGLVAQHLKAWCEYGGQGDGLYYWQTRSQREVDFVVYGPGGFYAFEVKHSTQIRPEDLAALRAFAEDYPEAQCALLHRGPRRELRHGILCLPVGEFLLQLQPGQPLLPTAGSGAWVPAPQAPETNR